MARLNYEEFKQYCTSNLQKIMGEEYPTYVESKNVNNDIVLDMLRLSKKSENISLNPGLDVMVLYENYCDGKALGEVMLEVVQKMENLLDMKFEVDVHSLSEFDNVKDNLIIRPLCYFRNKKLLQDFVYWVNGDVALVLYTLMQVGDENLATAKVTKKSAENYGVISEDYLKRLALENSERRFKPILLPQETLMFGGSDIEKIPMEEKFFTNPLIDYKFQRSRIGAYYLSIDQGVNGAIAVFYPGVLKAVSSILNDDLYVTFGCVRDATVHPASEIPLKMVKSAAKSNLSNPYISEDEFLSANVYKYNRKDDTLRMLS